MSDAHRLYPDAPVADPKDIGEEFQDFVLDTLREQGVMLIQTYTSRRYQIDRGEGPQGVEIKLDQRCYGPHPAGKAPTERLSIEVAERSSRTVDHWTPSGILCDSHFYVVGNRACFWLFSTRLLRRYQRKNKPAVETFNGTVQRWFLPVEAADRICIAKVLGGKVQREF